MQAQLTPHTLQDDIRVAAWQSGRCILRNGRQRAHTCAQDASLAADGDCASLPSESSQPGALLELISAFSCAYTDNEMDSCIHSSALIDRASEQPPLLGLHAAMPSLIYKEHNRQLRGETVQRCDAVSKFHLQRPCKLLIPPHLIIRRLTDR